MRSLKDVSLSLSSLLLQGLMTSALAVVRAPVRHGARGGKHECDKDEADKPLAFHPFTSKLK